MVVSATSLKRMKRRVTADLYDFLSFPSPAGEKIAGGPFRSNVRAFLTSHALLPPPSSLFPHLVTWQVLFRAGNLYEDSDPLSPAVVYLDIVEEEVARSRSVYCDQCRVVGWSGHPVCTKRYHFIVKADGNSIGGGVKACPRCGGEVNLAEPRCKMCNHVMTCDDVEDWVYHQLEDTTHLLHGVIHANGYGHLLRVNGREGGSRLIPGSHIMDFWDRLCKYLGVRKISVMDVSKKYGLEYRLLHAITNGHTWYGEWGYEFGSGSFALTHDAYREAVETLSSLPLSLFIFPGRKPRTPVQELILYYQSLSERQLVNIRDLFNFLMSLVHDVQKSPLVSADTFKKHRSCAPVVPCSWTSSDIKRVEDAMFKVLRAVSGSSWVSWRTLRGAVCKTGAPELLDFCLKQLGGKQCADGMTVHTRCNPDAGALEYRLEVGGYSPQGNSTCDSPLFSTYPSRGHVLRDLRFLYESLLHPQTMVNFRPESKRSLVLGAASRLLDCKQFVKDYRPEMTLSIKNPSMTYLLCQVELTSQSEEHACQPPPELIALSPNATLSAFKIEAAKAFREVYVMFQGFESEELVDYRGVEDSALVKLLFSSLQMATVRGRCPVKNGLDRFSLERGIERWTVDCSCGAQDDDGERMLACDVCGVWQHTRCAGIPDLEAVPAKFRCSKCRSPSEIGSTKIVSGCEDQSVVALGGVQGGGGKSLAMLFDVR